MRNVVLPDNERLYAHTIPHLCKYLLSYRQFFVNLQLSHSVPVMHYVADKFEVFTASQFRENRKHAKDRRTEGRSDIQIYGPIQV